MIEQGAGMDNKLGFFLDHRLWKPIRQLMFSLWKPCQSRYPGPHFGLVDIALFPHQYTQIWSAFDTGLDYYGICALPWSSGMGKHLQELAVVWISLSPLTK
jgi:hypothetical protein